MQFQSLANAATENIAVNNNLDRPLVADFDCEVGDYVRKFFPSYDWYEGSIHSINTGASKEKIVQIKYLDGDSEDITLQEVVQIKEKASIPIGKLGF